MCKKKMFISCKPHRARAQPRSDLGIKHSSDCGHRKQKTKTRLFTCDRRQSRHLTAPSFSHLFMWEPMTAIGGKNKVLHSRVGENRTRNENHWGRWQNLITRLEQISLHIETEQQNRRSFSPPTCPTVFKYWNIHKKKRDSSSPSPFFFFLFFFQFKLHRLQQTGDKLSLPENWNFSRRTCDKICRLTRPQYILPWEKGAFEAWHENWGGGAISKRLFTRYIKLSELFSYIVGLLPSFQKKQNKGCFFRGTIFF